MIKRMISMHRITILLLLAWLVASVSTTFPSLAKGTPGPSPLGTGDGGRLPQVSSDAADWTWDNTPLVDCGAGCRQPASACLANTVQLEEHRG